MPRSRRITASTEAPPSRASSPSDAPRHQKLYEHLRSQIEAGEFPVGRPFPTEEHLRAEHNVSRYSLREALHRLEEEGFIRRRRGSGATVISRTQANVFRHVAATQQDLISYAFATRVDWQESRMIRTDGRLARLLGCDELRQWQYLRGIRYEGESGDPLGVVQVYVDAALPPLPAIEDLGEGPIYRWAEKASGINLIGFSQDIMAKALTATEAEQLHDRPGAATLQILRRYFDATDAIHVISVNTYRSHDFVYNIRSQLHSAQ